MGIANDEELARMYAQEILGYTAEEMANWIYDGGVGKGGFTDAAGNAVGFAE
ncbi:MAG: hypothetical protein IKB70_08565 [Bacilli bacterium]|nr:hypothetical protein [Bacilli bacterium]